MSTPLPSFVELMASLGLEQKTTTADVADPRISPPSSPKQDPVERSIPSPVKAKSSPALREMASRQRATRFSPYSSGNTSSNRRGSVSSTSSYSSSSPSNSPIQESFGQSVAPRSRRPRNALCLNIYGSTSDLPANMPISTYVRRKTPVTSPSSPTFPQDDRNSSDIPKVLTIPVLPSLLPNSASSEAFPITPKDMDVGFSDRSSPRIPKLSLKPSPEYLSEHHGFKRRARGNSNCQPYFTGVRISTSSRYSLNEQYLRKDALVDTP